MNATNIADIFKALFLFYVFWIGISYYFGFGKYNQKTDIRRLKRVKRYGFILLIASGIALLTGISIFIGAFRG